MKRRAFLVDLRDGEDTISRFGSTMHNQKLYCLCGHEKVIPNTERVNKDILISTGESYINDIDGKISVMCDACGEIYDSVNQALLLFPGQSTMIEAHYNIEHVKNYKKEKTLVLSRSRKYVTYSSNQLSESNIIYNDAEDTLTFNLETKVFKAQIKNSEYKDANYYMSAINPKTNSNISLNSDVYSPTVDCSNLNSINTFFGYAPYIEYDGLEFLEEFVNIISEYIIDIKKIKKMDFISDEISALPILFKTESTTYDIKKTYYYSNDFVSNVEIELNIGTYLETITTLVRLYASLISFSNMSTVLFSKEFIFFDEFLKSGLVKTPFTYSTYNATKPNSIMEVSVNFDEKGLQKSKVKNKAEVKIDKDLITIDTENYFKVSNTIYKSLRVPEDLKVLYDFMESKKISKHELEMLFHRFKANDIYDVVGIFKQASFARVNFNIRHIKHALKYKLYVNYYNMRFAEEYSDTINTLAQIIDSKPKAKKFLEENYDVLPEDERDSYKEYLSIDPKCIFEVDTHSKLKKLHDELSVIYSVFEDAEKSVSFLEAVQTFGHLNQQIDSIKFSVIPSTKEMHREHIVMKHCINTYVNRVATKDYVAVRILDTISNEKATLGLNRSGDSLEFNQLKGYENARASKFLIDTVLEFCKKNKIKLENSNNFSLDLQSDKSKEKRMPDYLTEEEILLIRNQKLEEVVTSNNSPLNNQQVNSIIENFKNKKN